MSCLPESSRRGVALLIVLGVLAVVVPACAALAMRAATATAHRVALQHWREAGDLAMAAEPAVIDWLEHSSSAIVLPSDAKAPAVALLHDCWESGVRVEISVTAFDQCGMVPLDLSRPGSPLRAVLTDDDRRVLDNIPEATELPAGLDLFATAAEYGSVFPDAKDAPANWFGGSQPLDAGAGQLAAVAGERPAMGARVGTHNPGRLINVNTAPMPLIEAALRASGRGGAAVIAEARTAGRTSAAPPRGQSGNDVNRPLPVPTSTSSVWSFRIDASVGPVQRSWWSTYSRASGGWRCVQRLEIDR